MANERAFAQAAGRVLGRAIETLQSCRQHLQERRTVLELREVQLTLAALALAIEHEMEGREQAMAAALDRADRSIRPPGWYDDDTAGLH